MKTPKKTIIVLSIIFLAISLIPIILYIRKFSVNGTSNNPEDWALFGDYIGGSTNVILGLINIIITAYIAYLIGNLDNKRYKEQKEIDKQRFEDQKKLEDLRHQQSLELQERLFLKNVEYQRYDSYNKMYLEIISLITTETNLFSIEDRFTPLIFKIFSFLKSNKELLTFINNDLINEFELLSQKVWKILTNKFKNFINEGDSKKEINFNLIQDVEVKEFIIFLDRIDSKFIKHLKN
ncbi:hypothetical protein [Chishuiella changwenlii]|uniref:hypothetical protein n=1 Tax=Chishuiella changwenlii TaxID=1434701 RepID=UPI002FDA14A3